MCSFGATRAIAPLPLLACSALLFSIALPFGRDWSLGVSRVEVLPRELASPRRTPHRPTLYQELGLTRASNAFPKVLQLTEWYPFAVGEGGV